MKGWHADCDAAEREVELQMADLEKRFYEASKIREKRFLMKIFKDLQQQQGSSLCTHKAEGANPQADDESDEEEEEEEPPEKPPFLMRL